MKRCEAIEVIVQSLTGDELLVSSTGMISRELFANRDSPQNFYMLGSMGLSSSVGLGLALCLPHKKIVVVEGDGSVLMNLGSLATIGHFAPRNLTQVVLDNEAYDSTGGQPTVSDTIKLEEVARAAGYRLTERASSAGELRDALKRSFGHGPAFVLMKVGKGSIEGIGRVLHSPKELKTRFRTSVAL